MKGNYKARGQLQKRPPLGAATVEHLEPEAVATAPGNLRMTVVLEDGSGASVLLSLNDLPKMLETVEQRVRPLQLELGDLADIDWEQTLIAAAVEEGSPQAATMLALYFSWHRPGVEVPSQVEAALEHQRACITLAIDRRLGFAAICVAEEYDADLVRRLRQASTTANSPAQGTA